jgi:uncharacterized damage-inducible protein DinB
MTITTEPTMDLDLERTDLLEALAKHRTLFRYTVQGLTEEQAAATPTDSELCLGGLVKHVAFVEKGWVDFILEGTSAMEASPDSYEEHGNSFRMLPGETLAGILEAYEQVTQRTDDVLRSLPSLDLSHPLPSAPWFEAGASWSARRVFVHIVAETSQHAGHADILRETVDGQKSMG